ncbi:unnamed protein product, partial [Owenia fusiformis]
FNNNSPDPSSQYLSISPKSSTIISSQESTQEEGSSFQSTPLVRGEPDGASIPFQVASQPFDILAKPFGATSDALNQGTKLNPGTILTFTDPRLKIQNTNLTEWGNDILPIPKDSELQNYSLDNAKQFPNIDKHLNDIRTTSGASNFGNPTSDFLKQLHPSGFSDILQHSGGSTKRRRAEPEPTEKFVRLVSRRQHAEAITDKPVMYGELVILGYNGNLPQGDKGRRRSKYCLLKRKKANGVKPLRKHVVNRPHESSIVQDSEQHSVSYTLSRNQAIVVEYTHDDDTDMFQIGRSSDEPIDFITMDTIPGNQRTDNAVVTQSTISRFACRILVEREPPYTARIYAAGFDSAKNIFLGEKATKWNTDGDGIDGLTTNGILIMRSKGGFSDQSEPGVWQEVSVGGGIYALRESRSTPQRSSLVEDENNILEDGTLIDLCGATLLWRSAEGLKNVPSQSQLQSQVAAINAGRPQCPVGLNTLVLPSKNTISISDKQPYVYLECGHVHGKHDWGDKEHDNSKRMCPMCRKVGLFTKLLLGNETSLYTSRDPPTHCFCPCAHMASEHTVKYWASIAIPHGCHGFQAMCPFCATPLDGVPGFTKLIFQDNVD